MTSSKRRERDDESGSTIGLVMGLIVMTLFLLVIIGLPIIMAAGNALSGPVEYMVAIQDPSPEVNWYGWATYWCSHKDECKGIWDDGGKRSKKGERPNSEYIVS